MRSDGCHALFARADEADAGGERAALKVAEGEILRRIHHIVYDNGIGRVGSILHHAARPPILAAEMKFPFEARTEIDIVRKAVRAYDAKDALCGVDRSDGFAIVPFVGINKIPMLPEPRQMGQIERQPSPGDDAVGNVPRKRPALLRTL